MQQPARPAFVSTIIFITAAAVASVGAALPARFVTLTEALPVLERFADSLPPAIAGFRGAEGADIFRTWIAGRDGEIRARILQGDQDTLVNWLMYGTTFTGQPRPALVESALSDPEAMRRLGVVINGRIDDLLTALQSPGVDERRLFARQFFEGNGFTLTTAAGVADLRAHLVRAIQRIAAEDQQRQQEFERVRASGSRADELAFSQRMFWNRGLSLDTVLAPNFAIERSLASLKAAGRVQPASVRRVAIVGPGLDFADKNAGFDAYPVQTIQPFAVIDSLRRLGLAAEDIQVEALDISPRIVAHMSQLSAQDGYTLQLPLARDRDWSDDFRRYWSSVGSEIGTEAGGATDGGLAALAQVRAIRISREVVRRITVFDVNLVTERLDAPAFDLIIATNVLLYYDGLDQGIAMSNAASMLAPGGFLLSNTILPEVPAVPLDLRDIVTTPYTKAQDADVVLAYQRRP